MWKGKAILGLWAVALLVSGAAYQFGTQEEIASLFVWGVPTLVALVGSSFLVNWRSWGEASAQAIWIVLIVFLCFITILGHRVDGLGWFLKYGFLIWTVALSLGYISTGAAVRWRQMIVAGAVSLLFALYFVLATIIPPLEQAQYLVFAILHGGLLTFLALR